MSTFRHNWATFYQVTLVTIFFSSYLNIGGGGEAKCIVLLFLYDCHYSGQVQLKETILIWAGALVGDDSGSRVRGFESQHRILDGHFFTFVCCKNSIVCLKKAANKRKRGRGWPIYKTQFFWNVARHGANVKDTVLK